MISLKSEEREKIHAKFQKAKFNKLQMLGINIAAFIVTGVLIGISKSISKEVSKKIKFEVSMKQRLKVFKPTITETLFSKKITWTERETPLTDEEVSKRYTFD